MQDLSSLAPPLSPVGPLGPLASFHPSIQRWFNARHRAPTGVQTDSWPVIAAGRHALITAPTGSGKTLTAFLWSINRFFTGELRTGQTRVLYVSPLKALNNDIRVNLMDPLQALQGDADAPAIRVGVRSGDTSANERRRLLRDPPEILITTPESLHLMLTNTRSRAALASVELLIIDEVHALVDNRRGAQLSVSMERLTLIAGEFQRIALSATVHPLEAVAQWVAARDADGKTRPITTITARTPKAVQMRVRFPVEARQAAQDGQQIWEPLGPIFHDIIRGNRSTLFFANSRRLAEKITLRINQSAGATVAYAHHGSLSREIRTEVERQLKSGALKGIVATSSLEMGIDIGALDEVVLIQSPPGIAQTLQRIGRAGHQVDAVSIGTLFPSHSRDLIDAAVLARAIRIRDLEPIRIMQAPLDILVQIIISMCASEPWNMDDMYGVITRASAYHQLDRSVFDLVIDMLSGRFAGARPRELKPRIHVDRSRGTLRIAKGALFAMYASGGSIPDRGYFTLRLAAGGAVIGELDEEFVWEAHIGQSFTLGTQGWTIHQITHNDVLVRPATGSAPALPFWRSETILRSHHFSQRIGDFLEEAETFLAEHDEAGLSTTLLELGFDDSGAQALTELLVRQRQVTNAPLPSRHHLLIEQAAGGPDGYRGPDAPRQLILHTQWGGTLNQPYALALAAALEHEGWEKPEVFADNDAVVVQCRSWPDTAHFIGLVTPENLDALLRKSLEGSGHFGARFRESAQRSLLLSKPRIHQRLPFWMSRLQAKKLMGAIKRFDDFPVLLETWRTCLADEFDLPALRERLAALLDGGLHWTVVTTPAPSPLASSIRFAQISPLMYASDTPEESSPSSLRDDLISSALKDPLARPILQHAVIADFVQRRQRLLPDYVPREPEDLEAWVHERVLLPEREWLVLLAAAGHHDLRPSALFRLERDTRAWITHRDFISTFQTVVAQITPLGADSSIDDALERPVLELGTLYGEVLSFYGPLLDAEIHDLLPAASTAFDPVETLIGNVMVEGSSQAHWCERDNLEILFRLQRSRQRYALDPVSWTRLPALLAQLHGMINPPRPGREFDPDLHLSISTSLQQLSGFSAPVNVWLHDLLPSRCGAMTDADVTEVMAAEAFVWRGTGRERIAAGVADEMPLFVPTSPAKADPPTTNSPDNDTRQLIAAFRDPSARYTFDQVRDALALDADTLNTRWWDAVWAGVLTADSWSALQQAARRNFSFGDSVHPTAPLRSGSAVSGRGGAVPGALRRRLRGFAAGWPGNWQLLAHTPSDNPLQHLEDSKLRTRILLDRYGFLCRELVTREGLSWRDCFRTLRIMELAGEVVGGLFFTGLSGPQFAVPSFLHRLRDTPPPDHGWWVNAMDCVAPCGLGLAWPELPQRRPTAFLAFVGETLVLVAENLGRTLQFHLPHDNPAIEAALGVLIHLCRRLRHIEVQRINGEPAIGSAWLPAINRVLQVRTDHKHVELTLREDSRQFVDKNA